jgi:hypothetical protein
MSDHKGRPAQPGPLVRQDLLVPRVQPAPPVRKEAPVSKIPQAHQGLSGEPGTACAAGPPGPKGEPGQASALRHVEGSGDAIACNEGEVLVSAICKEGPATVQGAAAGAKCGTATGIVALCMRK